MDDTLTIDIESTNQATTGIDELIKKLEALKVKINENLKAIGRLNSALKNLSSFSGGGINTPKAPSAPTTSAPTPSAGATTPQVGNADTSAQYSSLVKLSGMIDQVNSKKIGLDTGPAQSSISNLKDTAENAERTIDKLGNKGPRLGSLISSGVGAGVSALKKLGSIGAQATGMLGRGFVSAGKKIISGFVVPTKMAMSVFKKSKTDISSMGDAVSSLTKKLRMTTLALLGARGAFTAIRKAVNAYMQYDTALSESLQSNWAILGSLLAPIIERLIALFSKLVSYIAMFIKMLTGVDLVARANAKALKSQASGASGAGKAVKQLKDELAGLQKFDDLNVAEFKDDTSGGSGGGAGASLPTLEVQDVDLKPLEKFMDFIKRNDWYGLGMEIARKFNDGLRLIDFDWLEQKARQWGKNMGDLFNGLTDGTDWALVGEKIAGGLNTAMGFVNTFFDTYNFDHLGEGLATGINGMVDAVHWEDVGKILTNKFKAVMEMLDSLASTLDFTNLGEGLGTAFESAMLNVDFGKYFSIFGKAFAGLGKTLSGFINKVDWATVAKDFSTKLINGLKEGAKAIQEMDWAQLGDDLANALKTAFANIDWEGVTESLAEFLGSAIGGISAFLLTFIGNLVTDIVNGIKDYFGQYIKDAGFEDDGMNIIAGIFNGIVDAIKNVGKWIYDHIFKPFIDGFKKAFGIASPSKVMQEQGGFIVDGFFDGVKNIWDKVKGVFTGLVDNIKNAFTGIKDFIKEKVNEAVTWIKEKFSWTNIKNTFETVKSNIATKFSNIRDDIKDKMKNAVDKLKSFFTWDNIKTTFVNLIEKIKEKFGEIGTTVGQVLSSKFNQIVSGVVNKAIDVINGFIKAINKIIGVLNDIPGVDISKLKTLDYPQLATGTNEIEVEGLYHLHQGEAVVPKKYNPAVNNKAYTENNAQMNSRLDTLIDLMSNLKMTNIVNIGDEELYNRTTNYVNRQSDVYGTSDW